VTVGERLKRRREQQGLTLTAMARRLRVAQATLCRWESGEREPQGAFLRRVEEFLEE
jgi:transcriptional regulator with XRE-family HTH domain